MWGKLLDDVKNYALGKQSDYGAGMNPQVPGAVTRIGRLLFQLMGSWIGVCWYTGFVNMRTEPGSGPTVVLGGPVIGEPDRGNRKPPFGNSSDNSSSYAASSGVGFNVPANLSARRRHILSVAHTGLTIKSGYEETRPMPPSLQACHKKATDCSGFATLVYKGAKLPDPNGLGYNGYGYTGTLQMHGSPTSNPQPGDLAFWQNPDHVAIVVGNGNVVEWGAPPGPQVVAKTDEDKMHTAFIGYRTYLR